MKRIPIFLAIMTGIIAVLFGTAAAGANDKYERFDWGHNWGKRVVFESQLVCPSAGPCEDCGGQVTVFTKHGERYVEFDFVAPPPPSFENNHNYYLYLEVLYANESGKKELPLVDSWSCGDVGETILYPIVVTTDEDGECHTGPILLDTDMYYLCEERIPGVPIPSNVSGPAFSIRVDGWVPPDPFAGDFRGLECGAWLITGF